jgi:hypothetical protein
MSVAMPRMSVAMPPETMATGSARVRQMAVSSGLAEHGRSMAVPATTPLRLFGACRRRTGPVEDEQAADAPYRL